LDTTGGDGAPKSKLRQQLLAAFDDLADQRDWEMAVRVIQSIKRDAPPAAPVTPAQSDRTPAFPVADRVKEEPPIAEGAVGSAEAKPALRVVVDAKRR
jgi:hypothetical protein